VDIRDSLSLGIRQKTDQLQTESGIQANRRQKPDDTGFRARGND